MLDYQYIFATELHKKLKPRIKGKINNLNLEYEYLSENKFSDMVLNGYSTNDAMYDVMNDYNAYVYNQIFWQRLRGFDSNVEPLFFFSFEYSDKFLSIVIRNIRR